MMLSFLFCILNNPRSVRQHLLTRQFRWGKPPTGEDVRTLSPIASYGHARRIAPHAYRLGFFALPPPLRCDLYYCRVCTPPSMVRRHISSVRRRLNWTWTWTCRCHLLPYWTTHVNRLVSAVCAWLAVRVVSYCRNVLCQRVGRDSRVLEPVSRRQIVASFSPWPLCGLQLLFARRLRVGPPPVCVCSACMKLLAIISDCCCPRCRIEITCNRVHHQVSGAVLIKLSFNLGIVHSGHLY